MGQVRLDCPPPEVLARGRLENYIVSVHGAPIAPTLLAEVCGLLADDPAAA